MALAFGWRGTFVAAGLAGLFWVATWLVTTRGLSFGKAPAAEADAYVGAGDDPVAGGIMTGNDDRTILAQRRTWAIAGAKLLSDATWWLLLFWLPDFFHRQFGMTGIALGVPLAIAYGGAAVGSLLGGGIPTRLLASGHDVAKVRKGALLVAGLCVLPIPLALVTLDYTVAVGLMALALAGHQAFSTNLFALIVDVVPQEKVGRVTASGSFSGNVGGMVIVKTAGLLLSAGYGYLPLLLFAAISYLAALGWTAWMLPHWPGAAFRKRQIGGTDGASLYPTNPV